MKFCWLVLLLLELVTTSAFAQNANTDKAVWQWRGTLTNLSAGALTLSVHSYVEPGRKAVDIAAPKSKSFVLDAQTLIYPTGDRKWTLPASELMKDSSVLISGVPAKTTQPVAAREIEFTRLTADNQPIDYFVAQDGDDGDQGSAEKPWKTIQNAINAMPSGQPGQPIVLHIGPGRFCESSDGQHGQLIVKDKHDIIITGSGSGELGGTHLSSQGFKKPTRSGLYRTGVLRVQASRNIEVHNLILGDDSAYETDSFFEPTVFAGNNSSVIFNTVWIQGPSRATTEAAERKRAPTVVRADDAASSLALSNVLVTGHGTFISNSEGKIACSNVTFAQMYGVDYDDNFLFLQTPHGEPRNARRFVFAHCIFYELLGNLTRRRVMLVSGDDGEDKAHFDSPAQGETGNIVVRARMAGGLIETDTLSQAFDVRDGHYTRAHGVFQDDDIKSPPTGSVQVDNTTQLEDDNGYEFIAPSNIASGWKGGFWSPLIEQLQTQKTANPT